MLHFYLLVFVHILLESLPVSSSGHLVLLESLLGRLGYCMPNVEKILGIAGKALSLDVFFHLLHGPTMIVVTIFFFRQWFFLLSNFRRCSRIILKIMLFTVLADSMTVIFFIVFKLFPWISIPLGIGFCITALVLYSLRWCTQGLDLWNWKKAVLLGCVQGCALLPGISRFATVYVSARWLGLPTKKAFEVTWLVQWPLIFAAFMQGAYEITVNPTLFSHILNAKLLIVVTIASVCAYLLLAFAWYLARKNQLWKLSWYMPVPIMIWLIFCR